MTSHTPHRTPLRRVSQGSLFALSRSAAFQDTPHGLGFLAPAISEFLDETDTLHTNIEGLKNLSESLATFNESFSSWLYIMNINALTVDWPQAPSKHSFALAKRRAEAEALRAMDALKLAGELAEKQRKAIIAAEASEIDRLDMDLTVNTTTTVKKVVKKKKVMSAKEKRERMLEIDKIITVLPLEFRGSDPTLRRNMEMVIDGMLNAPHKSAKLTDLIKPDLPQARVNKCLIALVARKMVTKDNSTGAVIYNWRGI